MLNEQHSETSRSVEYWYSGGVGTLRSFRSHEGQRHCFQTGQQRSGHYSSQPDRSSGQRIFKDKGQGESNTHFRVSKKDFGWQTKLFLPKMRLDGRYDMAGRILLIPLSGSGKIFIEIDDMDILLITKTRLYEKGGFTFDNVTSVRVQQLNLTRVRTYLDNLFNGRSKEVERSTNEFFNENWRDFYEALKPLIIETVENILYDVMSTVFHLIPANFFVEDIPTPQQLYGPRKIS
ncbi:protein takeout isoform X2 [Drosophila bipectinata]|uniref:protein takeout isoform X2 n=1 Tax=Drosophila bipectinata TaxID=42026 RepID=UPI0038B3306E